MATVANHVTDIINLVRFLEERETSFAAEATDADTVVSSKAGDIDGAIEALWRDDGYSSYRRSVLAAPTAELARRGFDTIALQLHKTLGRSDLPRDPLLIYGIGLRDDMITNSNEFESRAISAATPSAITGTGNGKVAIHKTDDDGFTFQNINAETLRWECIYAAGQGGVLPGSEIFEVRGGLSYRDIHEEGGSGNLIPATMTAVCATRSNLQILGNCDFDAPFGSTASATDKIPSWTISSGTAANVTPDSTDYYRAKSDGSAGQSLNFAAGSYTLDQDLRDLPANGPIYVSVRWMRKASATGNLYVDIGAGTITVDISTGTNDVWNLLEGWMYPDSYTAGGNDAAIRVASLATGTLRVDDLCVAAPTWIGGLPYVILAGSTNFVLGDYTTAAHAITNNGKVQKWFFRTYRDSWASLIGNQPFNLPHAATASSGYADP